ncbi:ribonuclease P protein component [Rhodococcoides kroppenstedtii]|uniref:ribonuclease P protein component n=1 Tax=Rhodococcoides kroppenstedtii TaxID=293050 RepID=UPI001427A585
MLPEQHRLHRSADFRATTRGGRRVGRRDVVVHVATRRSDVRRDPGGPRVARVGLVVSKAVGPAVTRHRVARRLRHVCASMVADLDPNTDVVVRALVGSATASSSDLDRQLRSALRRLGAFDESPAVPSAFDESPAVPTSGRGPSDR